MVAEKVAGISRLVIGRQRTRRDLETVRQGIIDMDPRTIGDEGAQAGDLFADIGDGDDDPEADEPRHLADRRTQQSLEPGYGQHPVQEKRSKS